MTTFPELSGYVRADGSVGIRNLIGVLSTVVCGNEVARWGSRGLTGVKVFYHSQGCCITRPDIERVQTTLTSLGMHPNLAGVIVVGLGCESVDAGRIADEISRSGKPVEVIVTQEAGGAERATDRLKAMISEMRRSLLPGKRENIDPSSLILGIKCGGSDTTSGIVANPILGEVVDRLLDAGMSVAFGETTELIGAEDWIVGRGRTPETQKKIMDAITGMEERAKRMGSDMRGGQPTGGNLRGGISTIEEKSLGAAIKTGTRPIDDVIAYGERIRSDGLFMVDTPGREPEFLTGIGATGAQLMAFTTGKGAPHGFPFMPVIKITGNPVTARNLRDHIDVDVSGIISGRLSRSEAADLLQKEIFQVINGKVTKAEKMGYDESMNIYITGPVI